MKAYIKHFQLINGLIYVHTSIIYSILPMKQLLKEANCLLPIMPITNEAIAYYQKKQIACTLFNRYRKIYFTRVCCSANIIIVNCNM